MPSTTWGKWSGTPVVTDDDGNFVEWRAVLSSDGTLTDLNELIDPNLGWHLNWARDINSQGQIVGYGILNGESRAYLLNPVPEPASITLFACGALVGLLWWRRKGREVNPRPLTRQDHT